MTALAVHIARPVLLWAAHFIAVYALISAACAERALLEPDLTRAAVALVTFGFALVLLVWMVTARRQMSRLDAASADYPLATAAWWTALISFLAVVANLWPVAIMTTCHG